VRSLSTQRQGYRASAGRRGHSVECLSGVHEISKVCLHTVYSHNTHRVTIPRRRPDGNQCEVPSTTHPFPANSASSKPGETIVNSSAVNTSPARRLRLRSISTFGIKFALQGLSAESRIPSAELRQSSTHWTSAPNQALQTRRTLARRLKLRRISTSKSSTWVQRDGNRSWKTDSQDVSGQHAKRVQTSMRPNDSPWNRE
jgi:hypothetical protein